MDLKLYKKTYPYICSSCGEFAHTLREYCEICGKKDSIVNAKKQDYKNAKT
ncbi:MAG: hypothetical protein KGD66_04630 [Candidatus Lokiarchaeota archaeon]|nr:hypothetical protein [Candidatus Lokiarchaeota archaeon]